MIDSRFQLVLLLILSLIFPLYSQSTTSTESPFPEIIQLEYGKTISFRQETIKRFLIMNPQVAEAFLNGDQLNVKAMNVGECSLLIWTQEERYRISIIVIPPPKQKSLQQERLENQELEAYTVNFFVDHSFFNNMEGSSFSNQTSSYSEQQSNLSLNSRFIKDSRFFLRGNYTDPSTDSLELNSYLLTISDITWPKNQKFQIDVGYISDNTSSIFSNISTFKGFDISPLKLGEDNPLLLSLFYGKEEESMDSYFNSRSYYFNESDSTYEDITDMQNGNPTFHKLALTPKNTYSLFNGQLKWNFYYTQTETDTLYHFYETQLIYTLKNFSLNYNIGVNDNTLSHSFSSFKDFDFFQLQLYKYYSPRTISPTNLTSNDKRDQNTITFKKSSREKIGILTGYNTYFKTDNLYQKQEDYSEETRWDYEWGFISKLYDLPFSLTLNYDDVLYNEDKQTIKTLYSSITKNIQFIRPLMVTISYRKSENKRKFNDNYSYKTDSYGLFINTRITNNFSYSIQGMMSSNNSNDDNQKSQSNNYGQSINYSHSAMHNTLYTTINLTQSIMDNDSDSRLNTTDRTSTNSVNISINKIIGLNSLFRTSYSLILNDTGNKDEPMALNNKYASRFETYFSTKFNTLFGWKPKTLITSRVFMDKNIDGKFTEGIDTPVPEAEILINDKPMGKTDKQGIFNAGEIKGFKTRVALNKKTIPEGYAFSTSSEYLFKEYKNSEKICFFGLILNTEVSGVVYNDINLNSVYDEEDTTINNVKVTLSNGSTCLTNFQGRYRFSPVPPGTYELSIDVFSIPVNFISAQNIKRNLTIEKGTYQTENFGFQAKRILKGTLYTMDTNGFKKPLPNAELDLAGIVDITNSKGVFKFKNISSGTKTFFIKKINPAFKEITIIPTQNFVKEKNQYKIFLDFSSLPETKELEITLK